MRNMELEELLSEALLLHEKATSELEKAKQDVLSLEDAKAGAEVVLAQINEMIEKNK